MDVVKKVFLFGVGVVTIAFEEASKAVDEAVHTLKEQREKINGRFTKQQA